MVNSVGKKLQQARLSKQLSIEEAARVTRIRPDKLLDLEEDNYSNFPSMSYAKGFLLLYARFLGVDVRDYADTLHAPNPVSSDDYEYLNAAASSPPPPPSRRPYHFSPRRERTILPVIVFAVLIAIVVFGIHFIITAERVGIGDTTDKTDTSSPSESPAISTLPSATPAMAAITPMPVSTPMAVIRQAGTPIPVARAVPVSPPPAPALRNAPPALVEGTPAAAPSATPTPQAEAAQTPPQAAPASTFDPTREVRRAEPVFPTPPEHAAASPGELAPVADGSGVSAIVPSATPVQPDAPLSTAPKNNGDNP
jgi:cytoskeletal protein RodZ